MFQANPLELCDLVWELFPERSTLVQSVCEEGYRARVAARSKDFQLRHHGVVRPECYPLGLRSKLG